ncbi:MAG: caspase family protein [Cyanobacteria bacterium P01_A01_bin.135]
MKRRHLIQAAVATLAAFGTSPLRLQRDGLRYARTLAQPTRRKRALLVGINRYPAESLFTNLKGCVQDVALQEQLLRHRFGFADIETLTDEAATRDNILTTFEEFLIKPCQEDDVVVFHFSGHGRRVLDPDGEVRSLTGDTQERLNSTLVTADDDSLRRRDKVVSDIMGRTLFLLTSALKTPNVTMVLDSCYAGGGVRGDTRVRSAAGDTLDSFEFRASEAALDYQRRWLGEMSEVELKQRRAMGIAKGIAIAAARDNQKAVDASFDQFHAGAFTYFLTQYLWQATDSVEQVIANVSLNLDQAAFPQRPLGCVAPAACSEAQPPTGPQPVYFVDPQAVDEIPAAAVLLPNQGGDRATIWLGGAAPGALVAYGEGAQFMVAGASGQDVTVEVISRDGLEAQVQLSQPLPAGTRLQEAVRVVPRNVALRIGLDPSLETDAAAFEEGIGEIGDRFEAVRPTMEAINGEPQPVYEGEAVHYILSRLTPQYQAFLQRPNDGLPRDGRDMASPCPDKTHTPNQQCLPHLPEEGSLVLLTAGIDAVVPGSVQSSGVAVTDALQDLKATLNTLYTARFVKLALNSDAQQVADPDAPGLTVSVRVELLTEDQEPAGEPPVVDGVMQVPVETPFRFVVTNREAEPLYLSILEVDEVGEVTPLFPNQFMAAVAQTVLESGVPKVVPDPNILDFVFEEPLRGEFLVMVSRRSPRQALIALGNERRSAGLPLVDALLADVSGVALNRNSTAQRLGLSTAEFAAFSLPFRVVGSSAN